MHHRRDFIKILPAAIIGSHLSLAALPSAAQQLMLLNVSYDPTRELYAEFNRAFAKHWKAQTGQAKGIRGQGRGARPGFPS